LQLRFGWGRNKRQLKALSLTRGVGTETDNDQG
jgi:hypothetical protein